jgi:hypothetical protein
MEWDRGNSKKKDQKRSQEDKEMAADHIMSLGGKLGVGREIPYATALWVEGWGLLDRVDV